MGEQSMISNATHILFFAQPNMAAPAVKINELGIRQMGSVGSMLWDLKSRWVGWGPDLERASQVPGHTNLNLSQRA